MKYSRRDRTKRASSGKAIRLVERDFDIFELLYRYSMLDSKTLIQFIRPLSEKRFIERLGKLYHDGYFLDRPNGQWNHYQARYSPVVHSLSSNGFNVLASEKVLPKKAFSRFENSKTNNLQFLHSLEINKTLAKFELECLSTPNQRFVPLEEILQKREIKEPEAGESISFPVTILKSEYNRRSHIETDIIPDGLFGIEYRLHDKKHYKFFVVEVERKSPLTRRTLNQSSSLKKLLAYKYTLHSKSFIPVLGIPNLFPVFVLNDQKHLDAITILATNLLSNEERRLFQFLSL